MKKNILHRETLKTLWSFSKSFIKAPLSMGMLCPSSPYLTKKLANQLDSDIIHALQEQVLTEKSVDYYSRTPQGFILELGAGTGVVTQALLKRGIPSSRILVFETCPIQCDILRKKFPHMRIIQDDAAHMQKYLPENAYVASIVSSLPFVSLPKNASKRIIYAMKGLLGNSPLIQYTYALTNQTVLEKNGFTVNKKHTVWLNFPPARVLSYGIA